jgi:hypothetical protein
MKVILGTDITLLAGDRTLIVLSNDIPSRLIIVAIGVTKVRNRTLQAVFQQQPALSDLVR